MEALMIKMEPWRVIRFDEQDPDTDPNNVKRRIRIRIKVKSDPDPQSKHCAQQLLH